MSNSPPNLVRPQDLAHAINNQLALITGHASLLQMSPNLSAKERDELERITQAVFRISEQVGTLTMLADATLEPAKKQALPRPPDAVA